MVVGGWVGYYLLKLLLLLLLRPSTYCTLRVGAQRARDTHGRGAVGSFLFMAANHRGE